MSTDRIAQFLLLAALAAALAPASAGAQASTRTADSVAALDAASIRVTAIEISPAVLRLARGDTVTFQGVLRDSAGAVVRGARWGVTTEDVFAVQSIKDREPDTYRIWGLLPGRGTLGVFLGLPGETPDEPNWVQLTSVEVEVEDYPVDRVEIAGLPYAPYAGTSFRLDARAITTAGTVHVSERVRWSSPDPAVASVDPDGVLTLHAPGRVVLRATAADRSSSVVVDVVDNPVARVTVGSPGSRVRTGDVVHVDARALDASGSVVPDAALSYGIEGPADASAQVFDDGAFVAEEPGSYRITASAGTARQSVALEVFPREGRRTVTRVGAGPVGVATTDLWVFEGLDGRDYAYTGTMQAATMYAWDVTDPARPVRTDSIVADGRRVNDVKINDARTLAVITSENASNRRNGITILDIREPAHPKVITHYTEGLTGGVHNVWFVGDLVWAVNDGTLDVHIIDISDPERPFEAGRWGLENPARYLHDVSVVDGLAYLSYWDDGLVILDAGDGRWGGTPTAPTFVSSINYRYDIGGRSYGNTHHAIRYGDYVFLGDEIFGCPGCDGPRGYVHVIDVRDIEHPREVATFELPEAGTHNLWVEDDLLYIAYYQGGLRVVDVSGELRGDLLAQGREVAYYLPQEAIDGGPMAWGPQPYKGHIFVADMNSGLWVVKMEPAVMIP